MSSPVTTFVHDMPFGAAVQPDGSVRFRLWAPAQPSVDVALEGAVGPGSGADLLPMHPLPGGWFELTTGAARTGSVYRYQLATGEQVPDPASRYQPDDVAGPSVVIDPRAHRWQTAHWRGRPWHETVLSELHVGTASPEGTFDGLRRRLDHFAATGITAVELMPLADFPGRHGWGYDGVLPFAPDAAHGRPDDLKALVDEAHGRGLMVFLDVVYNHFGPEGNWLNLYAPTFFTERHHTPWGAAINFDGADARPVRDFFIHNALYWLEEFRIDGLRLDAVHAIVDDADPHVLDELARTVRARFPDRHVHLVLENDLNDARRLVRGADGRPQLYDAQWNDDWHHAAHVLATGETDGYYRDYGERPLHHFARCLAAGFAYQGEPSAHRNHEVRGVPTDDLPPTAFVAFLQNHDQIGNRAFGERLITLVDDPQRLDALTTILLLAPSPPMLFMGEEWGARQPFPYFCDFHGELADAVRKGRREEFGRFAAFRIPGVAAHIPDPIDRSTVETARLDWSDLERPVHAAHLEWVRSLLDVRRREVWPLLASGPEFRATAEVRGTVIDALWSFPAGALRLVANLGAEAVSVDPPTGVVVAATPEGLKTDAGSGRLPPWSVLFLRRD